MMMMKLTELNKKEYLNTLQMHPLFSLLPNSKMGQTVKEHLLDQVVLHDYAKGELIFIQHSVVENLYFLLDGCVVCHRELPSGQACLMATYEQLGLINESVLWGLEGGEDKRRVAISPCFSQSDVSDNIAARHSTLLIKERGIHQLTATAKGRAMVASLPAQAYFEGVDKFELGELLRWFCDSISKRMYYHLISSDLLGFVQAKPKLAYYLLTHYPVGVPFELLFSQKQLASQIGLRPETLSRTLKELINDGLVTKNRSKYCLTDAEGLLALVSE